MATLTQSEESQLLQTIEMFEVITQSQPDDLQSLEILKEAYSKLNREQETLGTSKRIAEAYFKLGQLSSAILEYETILQSHPNDPDVRKALTDIERRANLGSRPPEVEETRPQPSSAPVFSGVQNVTSLDDGRAQFYKLFVDTKTIAAADFELCWPTVDLQKSPDRVIEPFLANIIDKKVLEPEKALRVLCDKSRLAYIPLERYDVDNEVARSFPREICLRWCVLPFDKMGKTIMVATVNPFNQQAAKDLSEVTKARLIYYLTNPADLIARLKKVFR